MHESDEEVWDEENEERGVDDQEESVTERKALEGITTAMKYYQSTWDCTPDDMLLLQKIQQYIVGDVLAANHVKKY